MAKSFNEIGIEDNFIELGGHSLAATRISSRLQEYFHAALPFDVFFRNPTVAGLCRIIERNGSETNEFAVSRIDPVRHDGRPLPLTFQQEQVWFLNQLSPGNLAYNAQISVYWAQHDEAQLSISELRKFVVEKLPDHMIPSAFVILKAIPRSINGKVDRESVDLPLRAFFEQPTIAGLALLPMHRMSEIAPLDEIDGLLNSLGKGSF